MTRNAPTPSAPESIVTDLEHARMLKEAGWPQDYPIFIVDELGVFSAAGSNVDYGEVREEFAAPTASELLHHIEAKTGWDRQQSLRRLSEFVGTAPDRILSNDVADWWCYLAKNGLLPTEA